MHRLNGIVAGPIDENDLGGEDDEKEEDITHQHKGCIFEMLTENIDLIVGFAKGPKTPTSISRPADAQCS